MILEVISEEIMMLRIGRGKRPITEKPEVTPVGRIVLHILYNPIDGTRQSKRFFLQPVYV
jgi:hypothetical protein